MAIKDAYDQLGEPGEDNAAEQFQEAHPVPRQKKLAKWLEESRLKRSDDEED